MTVGLAACHRSVQISDSGALPLPSIEATGQAVNTGGEHQMDMNAEAEVSEACVKAWRTALKGDEKGALSQLDQLAKKYPNVGTIAMIRGQIYQRYGDQKGAIECYRQAVSVNEFDSFNRFKLAESLRNSGNSKQALPHYRRLLKSAPDFIDGKLGLAKALHDTGDEDGSKNEIKAVLKLLAEPQPHNIDTKKDLEEILKLEPGNKQAESLLQELNDAKKTSKPEQ